MKKLIQVYLKKLLNNQALKIIVSVGLVFVSRFGFLPANFSPVGTLGFFSKSLWPLVLVTFGFDLFYGGWYPGFLWTYGGFLMYFFMGLVARKISSRAKNQNQTGLFKWQLILLPLASLIFFLLSNFGVWLNWYPRTIEGFISCYTLALPFYKNTIMGDAVFGLGYLLVRYAQKKYHMADIKIFKKSSLRTTS